MKSANAQFTGSASVRTGLAALFLAVGVVGSVAWWAVLTYGVLAIVR